MTPRRLAALLLIAAAPAAAAPARGAIEVRQAWSRPSAGSNGVGYMLLINHGPRADALVKAQSPLAERVEAHRSSLADGVMSMAAQPRVELPPGGQVAFAPGGYHLMFLGLKRPLKPGDRLPATLSFASGARVAVSFAVGSGAGPPAEARPPGPMGHTVARRSGGAEPSQFMTKK